MMAGQPQVDNERISSSYSILYKLADGAFGDILKVRSSADNQYYAVKVTCFEAGDVANKGVDTEADALFHLQHENIIFVKELFVERTGKAVWMVMELADLGNLEDYITASGLLSDAKIVSYITQLSRGMLHIHLNNFAHCDVTPRNLLLFSSGLFKIADFGQSVHCEDNHHIVQGGDITGDPRYMAPEVLRGWKYYAKSADVWSVGCCLYYMFTSKHLYQGTDKDIKRCQMKRKLFFPGQIFYFEKYDKIRGMISHLTHYDPVSRPALGQMSTEDLIPAK